MGKASSPKVRQVALELIDTPEGRVRLEIDPLRIDELAQSIKERGLLQPIILREKGERFEIVAGERRYLAFKQLGLEKIWSTVRKMSDKDVAVDRATENVQRDDLTPVEEGAIYNDLMETHKLRVEEVGRKMGKSPGVVIRKIHLLRMPACVQKAVHSRGISMSAAEELMTIKDLAALEYHVLMAVENGATQATCRLWAQDWKKKERGGDSGTGVGSLPGAVYEDKPIYATCELCHGAFEIGKEDVIRCCAECGQQIKGALKAKDGTH